MTSPTKPPQSVSTRFSAMTCVSSVRRLAPKALRTPISATLRRMRAATSPLRLSAGTNSRTNTLGKSDLKTLLQGKATPSSDIFIWAWGSKVLIME